jgi:hypothetical protein
MKSLMIKDGFLVWCLVHLSVSKCETQKYYSDSCVKAYMALLA